MYPIVIFCYRRPVSDLLESLSRDPLFYDSPLYIFSDGAKGYHDVEDVAHVRGEIRALPYFNDIKLVEEAENKGLANSVIDGVTYVLKEHAGVIILEDDLEVSPYFLKFMNSALDYYENDSRIWSIAGYSPPVFFDLKVDTETFDFQRASSWGWATWKDRWDKVDWNVESFEKLKRSKKLRRSFEQGGSDLYKMLELQMLGKIDSWAVRWCFSQFLNNSLTIYPVKTLVKNHGFVDGVGTHTDNSNSNINSDFAGSQVSLTSHSSDVFFHKKMKSFYDLSIITRLGYFLKKHGGYDLGKKIYGIFLK